MALSKYARQERNRVLEACKRLGMPADVLDALHRLEPARIYHSWVSPKSFRPPPFRKYDQSPEEWKAIADAEWQKFRDAWIQDCLSFESAGVDEPVSQPKPPRGPGKSGRNADIAERYEWAALRLAGLSYKEIASRYRTTDFEQELMSAADAVRKSTNELLRTTGLDKILETAKQTSAGNKRRPS